MNNIFNYGQIAGMIFWLILICLVIFITGKLVKNRLTGQRKGKNMTIIEEMHINHKTNLSLVKVGESIFLLGITSSNIINLKEWNQDQFELKKVEKTLDFKKYLTGFRRDEDD